MTTDWNIGADRPTTRFAVFFFHVMMYSIITMIVAATNYNSPTYKSCTQFWWFLQGGTHDLQNIELLKRKET